MRFDAGAALLPEHDLLSLNPMRDLELPVVQSGLTLVTKIAQCGDRRCGIGVPNEKIQIPEGPKAEIPIGPKRQDRALKRDSGGSCFAKPVQQARELVEKRSIPTPGFGHDRLKRVQN